MSSAGALRTQGNELFRSKRYFDAYRCYQTALSKCSPNDKNQLANIYVCLSKTELILEKTEDAISSATKAIEIDPSNYQGYLRRGNALCETVQFEQALEDYQHALDLEPSDSFLKQRIELTRSTKIPTEFSSSTTLKTTNEVPPRSAAAKRQEPPTQRPNSNTNRTNLYESERRYGYNRTNSFDRNEPSQQRQFNDTLRPHSIPDPKPSSRVSTATSNSSQSARYSSSTIIEMMNQMLQDVRPSQSEVLQMIDNVKQIISPLPNIVNIDVDNVTFHIVGDTHGQYQDVVKLFEEQGYPTSANPYLFNGDFVDRGSMGVEILIALMAWKLSDPSCIYFNRGNHETRAMNAMYGFERECTTKYNKTVYDAFAELFNAMQIGHILNKQVLIVHGGLSDRNMSIQKVNNENRFQQPSEDSVINDILWSDPMDSPGIAPSPRGVTHQFGPDVTQNVLQLNSLSHLIRSHQVQENGYLLQHNRKCITVFSAPNYIGSMYNKGAICNFTFGTKGEIVSGPQFITFSAEPIPRNYPPMKFSLFGGMF